MKNDPVQERQKLHLEPPGGSGPLEGAESCLGLFNDSVVALAIFSLVVCWSRGCMLRVNKVSPHVISSHVISSY